MIPCAEELEADKRKERRQKAHWIFEVITLNMTRIKPVTAYYLLNTIQVSSPARFWYIWIKTYNDSTGSLSRRPKKLILMYVYKNLNVYKYSGADVEILPQQSPNPCKVQLPAHDLLFQSRATCNVTLTFPPECKPSNDVFFYSLHLVTTC